MGTIIFQYINPAFSVILRLTFSFRRGTLQNTEAIVELVTRNVHIVRYLRLHPG